MVESNSFGIVPSVAETQRASSGARMMDCRIVPSEFASRDSPGRRKKAFSPFTSLRVPNCGLPCSSTGSLMTLQRVSQTEVS